MQPLLDALSQLGVKCSSRDGCLPVEIPAGGIEGGMCEIDGSISSQFISSLLIACTRAEESTIVKIKNPSAAVSVSYIDATLRVLKSLWIQDSCNILE